MSNQSRTKYIIKNAAWSYVGRVIASVLGLVNRTIIIHFLGISYLGITGLFANILGILSLAEFGLTYAVNYCLYKPIAENDTDRVTAYVRFFKRLYAWIIALILGIGIALSPFLRYLIKDPGTISQTDIFLFYFLYLLSTALSYVSAHSSSLMYAQQKGYQTTNIHSILNVFMVGMQTAVLFLFRNYLPYLLVHAFFSLLTGIIINIYAAKKNPFLKEHHSSASLSKADVRSVRRQMGALLVGKIGEVCVTSSDSLIISALNGLDAVGVVSNYVAVIDIIAGFTTSIVNAFVPSFGNILVTESKSRVRSLFKLYNFITFWVYGITSVCLFALLPPLIRLWVGQDYEVSLAVISCLVLNHFMYGMRLCPGQVATAAGLFGPNKYVSIAQGVVNLLVSIVLGKWLGVLGVFIGTIVSGLIPSIVRPIIVCKHVFEESAASYFSEYIVRLCIIAALSGTLFCSVNIFFHCDKWPLLILAAFFVFLVSNGVFILLFHRKTEYSDLKCRLRGLLKKN